MSESPPWELRAIALLQTAPDGMTADEFAERAQIPVKTAQSKLSKLAAYGSIAVIRGVKGRYGIHSVYLPKS
jgi:predicted ArsR family transcriptional regulator